MVPQRLDLQYRIKWMGRWHIGSGYQGVAADRLVRRMGGRNGIPFVPGSQIKGVLRHQCERLALTLGLDALDPHASSQEHSQQLAKHFVPLSQSDLVVDRLFGSRYQGECLFVQNALPKSEGKTHVSVRARTAMDRVTGTVMEQRLFTGEQAEGDIHLYGSLRARHATGILTPEEGTEGFPLEYSLLVAALLSLDALGGDKSVGLGPCEIHLEPGTLRWNNDDISTDDALSSLTYEEWDELLDMAREMMQEEI